MSLPQVQLDDRRFQDLVNEARLRIAQQLPRVDRAQRLGPGDHADRAVRWMTDMLVYRLNRIPDKLHVVLLELLGVQLARSDRRADPRALPAGGAARADARDPGGHTEIGTLRTASDESTVFQVTSGSRSPRRGRPRTWSSAAGAQDVAVAGGTAKPQGPDRLPFGSPPQVNDALYLGFDEDISNLLLQVEIDGSTARGAGVDPEDPPLRWEMSRRRPLGRRRSAVGSHRRVQLRLRHRRGPVPADAGAVSLGGRSLRWLRCRLDALTRSGAGGASYTHPPEIFSITAVRSARWCRPRIARRRATNSRHQRRHPGQRFPLRFSPVVPLSDGETLEVREPGGDRWAPWTAVDRSPRSGRDRHFKLDTNAGEVELGPGGAPARRRLDAVRGDPSQGADLRMNRYRHGGGRHGNVAADTLTQLRSAIPGVARSPTPAGLRRRRSRVARVARQRAAMEIRTRYRAVTAEDFEFLVGEASSRVGRTICVSPLAADRSDPRARAAPGRPGRPPPDLRGADADESLLPRSAPISTRAG